MTLKLPERLYRRLEAHARKRGATKSALVREALERHLEANGMAGEVSCSDLIHDLVGCLDGPADLSTSPERMKGYGR